jgi:hypothetical protein
MTTFDLLLIAYYQNYVYKYQQLIFMKNLEVYNFANLIKSYINFRKCLQLDYAIRFDYLLKNNVTFYNYLYYDFINFLLH